MAHPVLIFLLAIALLTGSSEALVSQQFDRTGKPAVSSRRTISGFPNRPKRYSVPEGINLRKDIRYEFYPVFGKTFTEIIRSVEESGPMDAATRTRRPTAYDWRFGWTYNFTYATETDEEAGIIHCDILIQDISVNFEITVTLPALTDDSALNSVEKEMWLNHLKKLIEQEHERVKIIKDDSADTMVRRISEIDYLSLNISQADRTDAGIERFIRNETEKIAKESAAQIRNRLEALNSEVRKKEAFPSRRR